MDADGDLCLNITSSGPWETGKKKFRRDISKKERMQEKRKRRLEANVDRNEGVETKAQSSTAGAEVKSDEQHSSVKVQKSKSAITGQQQHHNKPIKSMFSSLFTKNPEIPSVRSAPVTPIVEDVFTGNSFNDLNLHPHMVANLESKLGFTEMTAVQKATIPHLLRGQDVLIKSQTGSGKTLAYAVPVVENLRERTPRISRSDGPFAVVIVPTRELAIQSCDTFIKLTRPFTWVVPGSLMGGEKRKAEKARLRKGLNVIVATPGRILDHLQHTNSLQLKHVSWLIIDEADRLMDLGFEKDVHQIVSIFEERVPRRLQTVLLSATLSSGVEQLAGISLRDPIRIEVTGNHEVKHLETDPVTPPVEVDTGSQDHKSVVEKSTAVGQVKKHRTPDKEEAFAMPLSLEHQCAVVPSKLRLVTLAAFLLAKCKFGRNPCKMVVFFSTQDMVEFHFELFRKCLTERTQTEFTVDGHEEADDEDEERWLFKLHGDMQQKDRTETFQDFFAAKSGVLLCTDVAARGLDLPHVQWIVQVQPPTNSADYIHRVGRTARAGSRGMALLFLTPAEVDYVKVLNDRSIKLELIEMKSILKFLQGNVIRLLGGSLPKGQLPRTVEESAIALQRKMEGFVDSNKEARSLAYRAYQSFVRAYTTYPQSLRHIFNMKGLHLGHVAKSFCLADAPTRIGSIVSADTPKSKKRKRTALFDDEHQETTKKSKQEKEKAMSEWGSGLTNSSTSNPRKIKPKNKKKVKR